MTPASTNTWLAAMVFACVACAGLVPVLARFAERVRLVDQPGGRKAHAAPVPLVGGLAIFVAVATAAALVGKPLLAWFGAAGIVIAIGVWDDAADLSPRWRFAAQILATCVMIAAAGVELRSVGNLLGGGSIGLWVFVLPLTIFSVVGVVNSVNMLDGMDGLAGSMALVALAWYGAVAWMQGLSSAFAIAALHAAALAAFLAYNLRLPWRPRALVFLGDAGSMLLGLALAWLAIDLTQGKGRSFPPIAALWVVLLPLADCVSLMVRRIRAGRSPFAPDREHIHHYLIARGLSHSQTLAVLVGISALFGAIGFFGWRWGVAEPVLFWGFFVSFFAYHFWIGQQWRRLGAIAPSAMLAAERKS
jgi:UDP-GlcNAc:undecaprenyl-phosphate GlcNAc-1-phosphate transferase